MYRSILTIMSVQHYVYGKLSYMEYALDVFDKLDIGQYRHMLSPGRHILVVEGPLATAPLVASQQAHVVHSAVSLAVGYVRGSVREHRVLSKQPPLRWFADAWRCNNIAQ